MSAPESAFEAIRDAWDDAALNEVPVCRCGSTLKLCEYEQGECETCRNRLRIPCLETSNVRHRRRPS